MPRPDLFCLLTACEDAPGTEADLYTALYGQHLSHFRGLAELAVAQGWARWHYGKLKLTPQGRQILECPPGASTLAGRPRTRRTLG